MNWENRIDNIYTIDTMYKIDNYREPTFWHREFSSMLCGDLEGNLKKKGGAICIGTADSLCYIVETNTT